MNKADIETLLREGIAAAKAGQVEPASPGKTQSKRIYRIDAAKAGHREKARRLLMQVIEADETSVPAWLWLSTVFDDPTDKFVCLHNVLKLEPDNRFAQAGLAWLERHASTPEPDTKSTKVESSPPSDQRRPAAGRVQNSPGPGQTAEAADSRVASGLPSIPQKRIQPLCPFCRKSLSLLATRCSHCNLPLLMNCPGCGNRVEVERRRCSGCGQLMGNFRQRATYFSGLAAAYQKLQRHRQALAAWQAVEAIDPRYPQLHLRIAEAQAGAGQTRLTAASLRQMLEQEPGNVPASLALGKIFHQLHRWDEARAVYGRALTITPNSSQLHFDLGWLLMEQGKIKQALTHLRKAVHLDPQHGLAWQRLGQLYELSQKPRPAIRAYRRAVSLLPTDTLAGEEAQRRLRVLAPALPEVIATAWSELGRQMVGPILIGVLAALLDAGLRPWWIPWTGWVAIFLATLGAFLWASGTTLPYNPLLRLLLGEQGLTSTLSRTSVALFGIFCWLFALGVILLPIDQSFPEIPTL